MVHTTLEIPNVRHSVTHSLTQSVRHTFGTTWKNAKHDDMTMTCLWHDYDMTMTCLWHDYDMPMTCLWHDYDMTMTWLWQRRQWWQQWQRWRARHFFHPWWDTKGILRDTRGLGDTCKHGKHFYNTQNSQNLVCTTMRLSRLVFFENYLNLPDQIPVACRMLQFILFRMLWEM